MVNAHDLVGTALEYGPQRSIGDRAAAMTLENHRLTAVRARAVRRRQRLSVMTMFTSCKGDSVSVRRGVVLPMPLPDLERLCTGGRHAARHPAHRFGSGNPAERSDQDETDDAKPPGAHGASIAPGHEHRGRDGHWTMTGQ
jgi:hypothetical protein